MNTRLFWLRGEADFNDVRNKRFGKTNNFLQHVPDICMLTHLIRFMMPSSDWVFCQFALSSNSFYFCWISKLLFSAACQTSKTFDNFEQNIHLKKESSKNGPTTEKNPAKCQHVIKREAKIVKLNNMISFIL